MFTWMCNLRRASLSQAGQRIHIKNNKCIKLSFHQLVKILSGKSRKFVFISWCLFDDVWCLVYLTKLFIISINLASRPFPINKTIDILMKLYSLKMSSQQLFCKHHNGIWIILESLPTCRIWKRNCIIIMIDILNVW